MIYKLYVSIASWTFADVSSNELDIVNTMKEYRKINKDYRFIIIKSNEEQDELYKCIRKESDFQQYMQEIEETKRIKGLSCRELKKEIIDIYEKPKTKVKLHKNK